jgi:hypothetical protein
MMSDQKSEYLELIKEINKQKDNIKLASQIIISKIHLKEDTDREILEIMTALGKIGTMTGNANKFNNLAMDWKNGFNRAKRMKGGLSKLLLSDLLSDICMISFDIKKNGKKYEIKLPKIDFSLIKMS